MLPLDDPRWTELDHRNWRDGKPADWLPAAPFVPNELAMLVENPGDFERLHALWPHLCSEGTTWAAAFAAVPYFVDLAKRIPPERRVEYLVVVGMIVTDALPGHDRKFAIKDYLQDSYDRAIAQALPLIAETLATKQNVIDTCYLLSAVAVLQGHRKLAVVLQNLDCMCGRCPKCGEMVYPPQLKQAIESAE